MMFWRYPKLRKKTAADQVNHFQKRCLERVGVILSQRELKRIMQEGKLAHLLKQSLSRSLFVLKKETYAAKSLKLDVVLVYDKSRHAFVTVKPYESWTKNHDAFGRRPGRFGVQLLVRQS